MMAKFICLISLLVSLALKVEALSSVQVLEKVADQMQNVNTGLGIFSRSKIVSSVSRSLRGEDNAQVRESLNQAIVTLAVLDVGGGVLVPLASHVIDVLTTDPLFSQTREALKNFGTPMVAWAENLEELTDGTIRSRLATMKANIVGTFDAEVANLPTDHVALKHIRKAKKWLKVRTLGKVLGPLFDVATVGVNAWALQTAIRDCIGTPSQCNHGSLAAASLSIVSGLVGLATFAAVLKASAAAAAFISPIGAIIAAALGITATLIELFYTPPPDPEAIQNSLKEATMRGLDVYSRFQLNHANRFLAENNVQRGDLYVVNQGHLPKWFVYSPRLVVKFGKDSNNRPRKKLLMNQQCRVPVWGDATGPPIGNRRICPYLADGEEITSTLDSTQKLGYSFYGFTPNARDYLKHQSGNPPNDNSQYRGSIVMVATDKVQQNILSEKGLNAKLRGLDLDTGEKSGDNLPHDDLIALGDMPSLDANEVIKIRMGKGNDALNIDGRLGSFSTANVLDAELGLPGHNSLNFGGMANDYGITGIVFDVRTGNLEFKHGSTGLQIVGTVKHVEILGASPFNDKITLYASRAGSKGFDFTVFKFNGLATYKIDIAHLAGQSTVRHFKIIDATVGGNGCAGHVPVLKLVNFANGAKANDILYQDDRILVHGQRTTKRKRRESEGVSDEDHEIESAEKRQSQCSGETGGNPVTGAGGGKVLLATIALYTKCPVSIEASAIGQSCVMSRRTKSEIDVRFFPGSRLHIDFNQRSYTGSNQNDYALLKCPSSTVSQATTIDLSGGSNDVLVLSSDIFLDPCGIDGASGTLTLEGQPNLTGTWKLKLSGNGLQKFTGAGRTITIIGVEKIINEQGRGVLSLPMQPFDFELDLYREYALFAMDSIGAILQRDRTLEVKEELLTCLKQVSSMTQEERELCET